MKQWLAWVGGALAAVALVVSQTDAILTFTAKRLGPYLAPYFTTTTTVTVKLDPALDTIVDVIVADPANANRALLVGQARRNADARLNVPVNVRYIVAWQGEGLKAGTGELWAVDGATYSLALIGKDDEGTRMGLRRTDAPATAPSTSEPSADLLLSGRAARAVDNPAAGVNSNALPELDRAVAVVGLFETGTTDCARRLAIVPGSVSGGRSLAVGCVGAMAPGWLTPVLKRLDGNAGAIEHLFGDDATAARTLLGGGGINEADVRRVSRRLAETPEFWIAYQDSVLDAYAQATALARTAGFVSERGRLLVFDRMANSGVGSVNRAIARYAELFPDDAPNRPTDEASRLKAFGEIFKAQLRPSGYANIINARIDTIVSGKGSVRGISFSLDQLGVPVTP
jgi:hypothetical protein